jgi:hypothetical protein
MIFLRQAQDGRLGGAQFAARLTSKARRLTEARIERRGRESGHWRVAPLLWPLFTKEP